MLVMWLRHGEAESKNHGIPGEDEKRKLTSAGRDETALVAKALNLLKLRPHLIYTSPLVRARKTAEIASKHLKNAPRPVSTKALLPDAPWSGVEKLMNSAHKKLGADGIVLLCGHQPGFSTYVLSLLKLPKSPKREFPFPKSACFALKCDGKNNLGKAHIALALSPEIAKLVLKSA